MTVRQFDRFGIRSLYIGKHITINGVARTPVELTVTSNSRHFLAILLIACRLMTVRHDSSTDLSWCGDTLLSGSKIQTIVIRHVTDDDCGDLFYMRLYEQLPGTDRRLV